VHLQGIAAGEQFAQNDDGSTATYELEPEKLNTVKAK